MELVGGLGNLKTLFGKGRNKLNYQIVDRIHRYVSRSLSLLNLPNPLFFPYKNNGRSGCGGMAPKSVLGCSEHFRSSKHFLLGAGVAIGGQRQV